MLRKLLLGSLLILALVAVGAWLLVRALEPPRLPVPERGMHVFRDLELVTPGGPTRSGRTLRIEAGRIVSIEATASAPARESEHEDLAGLHVLPGLIDMHVHYPPALAVGNAELWSLLFLAHGVTTVREAGSIDGESFAMRTAIGAGEWPGPRVLSCGAMLDGAPPSFPTNRVVRTPDEARAAVAEQVARGADCIKVYNMLSAETQAAIVAAAREARLPVIGHKPHAVSLEEVRIDELQHLTGAPVVDLERIGLADFRTEDWEGVDDARIEHVVAVSRKHGIAHTPTLVNFRLRRRLAGGADGAGTGAMHLPRFWEGVWATLWPRPWPEGDVQAEAAHTRFRERAGVLTARLHRAGVAVHPGTDTLMPYVVPGASLHGELAEWVAAGIPAPEAWRAATRGAGQALGIPGLATLEPGAPADLLFFRRDPTHDLAALESLEAVMADGRLYRRADLASALARFDAHFHGSLYVTVMDTVVSLLQGGFAPRR